MARKVKDREMLLEDEFDKQIKSKTKNVWLNLLCATLWGTSTVLSGNFLLAIPAAFYLFNAGRKSQELDCMKESNQNFINDNLPNDKITRKVKDREMLLEDEFDKQIKSKTKSVWLNLLCATLWGTSTVLSGNFLLAAPAAFYLFNVGRKSQELDCMKESRTR